MVMMMEENPLEQALLQLAKTMGVNLTGFQPISQNEKNISPVTGNLPPSDTPPTALEEGEEGELVEDEKPHSKQPLPRKSTEKARAKAKILEFTGEIDAESLLRGPPAKMEPKANKRPKLGKPPSKKCDALVVPKVPCRYWMEGKCSKGDECTFSHAIKPNKTADEAKSEEVCRFHIAGNCLKGENCMYSHDLSRVPCKFFHVRGECGAADSCRFSHSPLSEDERHRLFVEMMGTRDPRLSSLQTTKQQPILAPLDVNTTFVHLKSLPPMTTTTANNTACSGYLNIRLDPAVARYNPFGSPF